MGTRLAPHNRETLVNWLADAMSSGVVSQNELKFVESDLLEVGPVVMAFRYRASRHRLIQFTNARPEAKGSSRCIRESDDASRPV